MHTIGSNKLASKEHAAAILELAGFYRRGDVVEQTAQAALLNWWEQAATLGDVQAMRDIPFILCRMV